MLCDRVPKRLYPKPGERWVPPVKMRRLPTAAKPASEFRESIRHQLMHSDVMLSFADCLIERVCSIWIDDSFDVGIGAFGLPNFFGCQTSVCQIFGVLS